LDSVKKAGDLLSWIAIGQPRATRGRTSGAIEEAEDRPLVMASEAEVGAGTQAVKAQEGRPLALPRLAIDIAVVPGVSPPRDLRD
jgi:hypothetical protein